MNVAVIGGGPAGLRAAEIAAANGLHVTIFDAKPSVGRKLLVAGKGGLNLTKAEPPDELARHFSGPDQPPEIWPSLLADFDAGALREWAAALGVETFAASTGRVYPRDLKAAPLLRRWVQRLRGLGVQFAPNHRWTDLRPGSPHELEFAVGGETRRAAADTVVLALGGGSWPQTGSDGSWTEILARLHVTIAPLQPANCGWEIAWPAEVLARAEGQPLKNIAVRAGESAALGELLVTSYGLEGGALYALAPALRAMPRPELCIDFKPDTTAEKLVARLGAGRRNFLTEAAARWRLSPAAAAILEHCAPDALGSAEALAGAVKNCCLHVTGPRPLAEAISSAGGVRWPELNRELMLERLPGVFVAGEMIDWEAPTGGYLIHGCLATGTRAGIGAVRSLRERAAI